ncbi:sensor histidine kinase response [Diplodia corticola]|uniref:histidine kinase n=1 Tax=Diplodia corticola TaxID=236234 RepID=A0A1J9QPZ5_9PEZI|nr:sensor histidine kinase response [Diplodia corticola]OJD30098.1 sensor histidine kinase response [Diplodia corticola]
MGCQQPEPAALPAACTDSTRARELYKYFQPPRVHQNLASTLPSASPDTVLTAHAQLVAWRLNVQRVLISLIDRETQYFVAESTKTLDLADSDQSEVPEDAIWAGGQCNLSVPKRGRLCEHTLEQVPSADGTPASFEVLDLTKDGRFSSLPFVAGEPHFRYYVGVPLKTKKGIPIGSLFAMDVKVREPLKTSGLKFLTIMASNVMAHLELMKEKEDRKRAVNMNMCLAAFVDPEHPLRKRKRTVSHQRMRSHKLATFAEHKAALNVRAEERSESIASPKLPGTPRSTRSSRRSNGSRKQDAEAAHSGGDSESETNSRIGDTDHPETFERASKGLFDSLSLRGGGGVVFMSTTAGLRPDGMPIPSAKPSLDDLREVSMQHRDSVGSLTEFPMESAPSHVDSGHSVDILAHAVSHPSHHGDQESDQQDVSPLSPDELTKLIRRHPRGKLYSFGDDGLSQGSSGEESHPADYSPLSPGTKRRPPSRSEAAILAKHFPGARQVIFVPFWDVQIESWVACFAYNTSDFRTFGHNPDFLHAIAFCCCIMTEVARLATLASDQQKSDFIGSISHELRSPLHGILASCEFLEDTDCSSYQKSLVSTADSCARTLLDTINMVLDYSKINSFERNIRKAKKSRKDMSTQNTVHPAMQQPSLNIYDAVDLAAIMEEVVAGVALGHAFRDITTFEGPDDKLQGTPNRNLGELETAVSTVATRPAVEIIMSIDACRWDFVTQPGAVRRIVMNLFGNAIKYTRQGFIRVSLSAKDIRDPPPQSVNGSQDPPATSIVTLTISDSGQGISPEYLRTKLFTPFAQENPLNPGTGLGLSLVRSLVDTLNGDINVRSVLGVGTEVVVTLPMVKSGGSSGTGSTTTPASVPASTVSTTGTGSTGSSGVHRPIHSCLNSVRLAASGMTAALFRPPDYEKLTNPLTARALEISSSALEGFLRDWYGFLNVVNWSPEVQADLIAVDEVDLPYLLELCPSFKGSLEDGPILLVIRAGSGRCSATDQLMKHVNLEYLSRPVGPYKLAKALQNVMEKRARKCNPGSVADSVLSLDAMDDADEVVTHVEQITLNTSHNGEPETMNVLLQGEILGNDESMNAHMALDTLPSPDAVPPVELNEEFPFPDPTPTPTPAPVPAKEDGGITSPSFMSAEEGRPHIQHSRTMSWTPQERLQHEAPQASPMSSQGLSVTTSLPPPPTVPDAARPSIAGPAANVRQSSNDTSGTITPSRQKSVSRRGSKTPTPSTASNGARMPRLLLVDDNAVNLRLLQTFMRKRAYSAVYSAADGAQAVAVFESLLFNTTPTATTTTTTTDAPPNGHTPSPSPPASPPPPTPPDIVFMDISMPIMNGFEATRRIRALEADFAAARPPHARPPPALIVALTGLASGRDQSEAFTSGFDLYMTKPVSFREVGRLLDNWVANGGVGEGRDGVAVGGAAAAGVGMGIPPAAAAAAAAVGGSRGEDGGGMVGMGKGGAAAMQVMVPFGPVVGEV